MSAMLIYTVTILFVIVTIVQLNENKMKTMRVVLGPYYSNGAFSKTKPPMEIVLE
jgi:hypothetical protein